MIYSNIQLFKALSISGGNLQYEDDLHKPLLTSGDITKICSGQEAVATIIGNVVPKNGSEFREMIIDPLKQIDLLSPPHFLRADTSVGTVYGWIDRVTPLHESDTQRSYRLEWHPDWWLTAQSLSKLGFGPGRLLKGPASFARPSGTAPRKWLLENAASIIDGRDPHSQISTWWAVMCTTKTSGTPPSKVVTDIVYYFWPIGEMIPKAAKRSPNWVSIYTGQIEEQMGIDPSRIQGFWLAPFKPWMGGQVRDLTGASVYELTSIFSGNINTKTLTYSVQTDNKRKIIFTDPTGAEMFTAPWGISFKTIVTWFDIGTSAAALCVYLGETDTPIDERKGAEGRFFSFPLPSFPVTENAWSSYVYSGQREYDIAAKKIQRDESAVNGISGIGTSAIGGAIAGSMVAPGIGTVAGLIGGAVSSAIGTAANYFTAGKFDNREQRNVDTLTSRQTAGMIVNAGGYGGIMQPYGSMIGWNMLTMVRDPVSLAELDTAQTELGYDTDFYAPDCSNLISAGGPLQISGLQVITDLPNDAKTYISAIFQRGVYIDVV